MSDLREALEVLMDGDEVRELSRHTVTDFPAAVATLAEAARKVLDPITDEEVEAAEEALDQSFPMRTLLEAFLSGRWPDR